MRRAASLLGPILVPAAAVLLWWRLSAGSTSIYFPPLEQILTSFRGNWLSWDSFREIALPSVVRLSVSMAIAFTLGVLVGTLVGLSRLGEALVRPELEFMRALPPILLIPPMILVLGTGNGMNTLVIVASAIWPILIATADGVRTVEPVRDDMVRVFGLPWRARLRHLSLPTAVPHIWSGVQAAVPIAIVVMISAEYYASSNGIGYFISQTTTSFRLADMWSAVLLLGLIGVASNGLLVLVGRELHRRFGEYARD